MVFHSCFDKTRMQCNEWNSESFKWLIDYHIGVLICINNKKNGENYIHIRNRNFSSDLNLIRIIRILYILLYKTISIQNKKISTMREYPNRLIQSRRSKRLQLEAFATTWKELDPLTKRCLPRRSSRARVCAFVLGDYVRVTSGILVSEYSSRGAFKRD